ncbi:MAG: chorismate mutase [Erysipelotrichaceae bacterium]|nr:chorismate mutase [Erysipelotrichaceae bacterium]
MNELELLRKKIDEIDTKLCELFENRMEIAKAIGQYKKEHNLDILDASREEIVLNKAKKRIKNKDLEEYYLKLVVYLMDLSKKYQND